jgi:hypothetical protein
MSMSELNVRAVVTGSLVDIVGSFVVGSLFFAAIGVASGATSTEELNTVYDTSVTLQLVTLGMGLTMTGAGAYVAARMTKGAERLHAFAVGVISTAISFTVVFAAPESQPFWSQAASLILTIPAAFAGGEVRRATIGRGRRPA